MAEGKQGETLRMAYLKEQKMEAEIAMLKAQADMLKAQAERVLSEVSREKNEFHEFHEFSKYVSGFILSVDERIHALEKSMEGIKNRMGQCA